MRVLACLLLSALLVQAASGASLLRFINTIPTRQATDSLFGATSTLADKDVDTQYEALDATKNTVPGDKYTWANTQAHNLAVDRVGIQYWHSASTNNLNPAEVVWTETLAWTESRVRLTTFKNLDEKQNYWAQAMPPLRVYHKVRGAAASKATLASRVEYPDYDRLTELTTASGSETFDHTRWHYYEHSQLKADGIGLYMSFAPGSYKIEAYGVQGLAASTEITNTLGKPGDAPYINTQTVFPTSRWDFTFQDNKVYTLVATGSVNWASLSNAAHSVRLKVIEEILTPTTFGKASIRFFHAAYSLASSAVDVYDSNDPKTATKLVSGLGYEGLSVSTDVDPSINRVFPLGTGSAPDVRVITQAIQVTSDIRAGMRATYICAQTAVEVEEVFCRMIPSRVVAYVRLVNDMAGWHGLVQGKFGPQRFSETTLTLYGSYNQPDIFRGQHGSRNLFGGLSDGSSPASTQGLYPVVKDVAAGSVSGYGEVFVPVYIMDFAVRPQIWLGCAAAKDKHTAACADSYDNIDKATSTKVGKRWYEGSPIFKRVSFIIKTDGYSTVDSAPIAQEIIRTGPVTTKEVKSAARARQTLGLRYVEPGAFYSIYIAPQMIIKATSASATDTVIKAITASSTDLTKVSTFVRGGTTVNLDLPYNTKIGMSCDRTVEQVAEGITSFSSNSKMALLVVVQMDGQAFHQPTSAPRTMRFTPQLNHLGPKDHTFPAPVATDMHPVAYQMLTAEGAAEKGYRTAGAAFATGKWYEAGYALKDKAGWTTITLEPDVYSYQFPSPGTGSTSLTVEQRCQQTIPNGRFTVEANTVNYLFVMNQFGCRYDGNTGTERTDAQTSQSPGLSVLFVTAAGVTQASSSAAATTTTTTTQTNFFGAASAVSSSMAMIFAAVLAAVALLF